MNIAIASGKGGTGKTTVAVNLAAFLARGHYTVCLADCDVEEPNAHIFLAPVWREEVEATLPVPEIDEASCLGVECRKCVDACRFKALAWMGDVMRFPEMCHGCGVCSEVCPNGSIFNGVRVIGSVKNGISSINANSQLPLTSGQMRIGEAMAPPLIRKVMDSSDMQKSDIVLRDCPPGTSCPMITSVDGADFAVLVTEPTPFGLHDLTLAVECLEKLHVPFGVVINRYGIGDNRVAEWCDERGVDVLGTLPFSTEAAAACSRGELLIHAIPELEEAFGRLWKQVALRVHREVL